jgi:hypothetical protein
MIRYDKNGEKAIYNVFPFNEQLAKDYHLVIINKPYVPLIADEIS